MKKPLVMVISEFWSTSSLTGGFLMPGSDTPHLHQTVTNRLQTGWNQLNVTAIVTMAYVRWTKGFTNCCGEICVTVARPPARRRGGGTPDDRAWKPHSTAASAGCRAARDQGEQR